jgi:hypothetical protein
MDKYLKYKRKYVKLIVGGAGFSYRSSDWSLLCLSSDHEHAFLFDVMVTSDYDLGYIYYENKASTVEPKERFSTVEITKKYPSYEYILCKMSVEDVHEALKTYRYSGNQYTNINKSIINGLITLSFTIPKKKFVYSENIYKLINNPSISSPSPETKAAAEGLIALMTSES